MSDNRLYEVLGVSRNSSESEIKKNYYKLAKEFHPDKNPEAGDKFKEISFAYEVLTNPEKRQTYDRFGMDGLKEGMGGGGMGGFPGDMFGDLFGGLFGGMGGFHGGGRRGSGRRKGEDTIHPLRVTLEDLYNAKVSKLQLKKTVICRGCKGIGGKAGSNVTCRTCNGRGMKITMRQIAPGMVQQMQSVCPQCRGEGEMINEKDRCSECRGTKVTKETKILEVHVDKGMKDGQKIPFRGEGDQMPGTEAGDVIIVIQQKEHDTFQRQGADLICTYNLGLTEALCGFTFKLKHLDGRDLLVKNAAGTVIEPGMIKTVHNEGMPIYRSPFEKGNLFIKFSLVFPGNNFTSAEKLKELAKLLPPAPRVEIPIGDDVEEVELTDNIDSGSRHGGRNAYDEDEDDEGMGGPRVQCAHQ